MEVIPFYGSYRETFHGIYVLKLPQKIIFIIINLIFTSTESSMKPSVEAINFHDFELHERFRESLRESFRGSKIAPTKASVDVSQEVTSVKLPRKTSMEGTSTDASMKASTFPMEAWKFSW